MKLSKLFKVTSTSSIKPELTKLYLKDSKLYATDSFKAVIIDASHIAEPEQTGYITLPKTKAKEAEMLALKIKQTMLPDLENDETPYPDFTPITPTEKQLKEDYIKFSVNRKFLIDLLEAMQEGDAFDRIVLHINKNSEQKIALLRNTNGTGLIMSLNK